MGDALSCGQSRDWYTHTRTHRPTDTADDNTRRPKLASGKNQSFHMTEQNAKLDENFLQLQHLSLDTIQINNINSDYDKHSQIFPPITMWKPSLARRNHFFNQSMSITDSIFRLTVFWGWILRRRHHGTRLRKCLDVKWLWRVIHSSGRHEYDAGHDETINDTALFCLHSSVNSSGIDIMSFF